MIRSVLAPVIYRCLCDDIYEPDEGTAGVPFADLPHGGCKWPFGSGEDLTFCAAPALRTPLGTPRPYCACHSALATTKPRPRKLGRPVLDTWQQRR